MYCKSCRTRLSPKDKTCPSCGQRVASSSHDLGSGSTSDLEALRAYPLPPPRSWDTTDPDPSKSQSETRGAVKPPPPRKAKEPRPAKAPKPAGAEEAGLALGPDEVRRIVAAQPELIEDGLRVHADGGKPVGVGFETAVGEIDLLARDSAGSWVVVQVADPDAGKELVADLLQRMGWVRKHLCESGQEVRAIVLLDSVPEELGYAASAVADSVEFKRYLMRLAFESVEP